MKPAWTSPDDRAVLYQGEAYQLLRQLPDASADAVVTDPPYSSGGFVRSDRIRDAGDKYVRGDAVVHRPTFSGDNRDARSWLAWMTLWLTEAHRITRPGGYCLIFTDWRQLPTLSDALQAGGFVWRGVIVWDKGQWTRTPNRAYFRHQAEYILWSTNGPTIDRAGGPFPGVYSVPWETGDRHHMTGKPTPLLRELVRCLEPEEAVLDPFAGSGTTGVAAIERGLRFIGIEREPHYIDVARRRLEDAVEQLALFPPTPTPEPYLIPDA